MRKAVAMGLILAALLGTSGVAEARKKRVPTTFTSHFINYNAGNDTSFGGITARKSKCKGGRTVTLIVGGVVKATDLTDASGAFFMNGNWGAMGQSEVWVVSARRVKRLRCLSVTFSQ